MLVPVSTPLQVHHLVEEALSQRAEPSAIEVDLPTPVGAGRPGAQPPGSVAVLLEGGAVDVAGRAEQVAKALGDTATVTPTAPRWWGRYPFGREDVALRITVAIADLHAAVYALRDATGASVPVRGSAGRGHRARGAAGNPDGRAGRGDTGRGPRRAAGPGRPVRGDRGALADQHEHRHG
nr:hypothetical protein GCM10020092_106170 [Actinoplanes digitatis]